MPVCADHHVAGRRPTGFTFDEAAKRGQDIHTAFEHFGVSAAAAGAAMNRFLHTAGATITVGGQEAQVLDAAIYDEHGNKLPLGAPLDPGDYYAATMWQYGGIPVHTDPRIPENVIVGVDFGRAVPDLSDVLRDDPDPARFDLKPGDRPPNFALSRGLYRPDPHGPPAEVWDQALRAARQLGHRIRWSTWVDHKPLNPLIRDSNQHVAMRAYRVTVEPASRAAYSKTTYRRINDPLTIVGDDPAVSAEEWPVVLERAGIVNYGRDDAV